MSNDTTDTKTCTKCGQTFPATLEYFHARKRNKDGLQLWCKACVREYDRTYRQDNQEDLREQRHKYYRANKDKIREYHREYRQSNQEKVRDQKRNYQQMNQEKVREYKRKYYQKNKDKNRDKKRELSHRYRQENKDKIREKNNEYRLANLAKYRIARSRRRARLQSLPDTFTEHQWQTCLEYHNYCCAVCGAQLRDLFGNVEPHADHWIPITSDECTGTIVTNMICLCSSCNHSKHAKLPEIWLKEQYGTRKANEILKRVDNYFKSVSDSDESSEV